MIIVQCPHCNVFRNPEKEPICQCEKSLKTHQHTMALIIAEHEKMRERLIELEEITTDLPIRWTGSGEPIVQLEKEVADFLKKTAERTRKVDGVNGNFSNN